MKKNKFVIAGVLLIGMLGAIGSAQAAVITLSLGNTTPGFNDGDTPAVFAVGGAQGGNPAPFDTSYGTDGLFGGNFSQNWTHSYAAIADTILSASISIGIYDHDSSASGSQLASFVLDGVDFTTTLDGLFEAAGEGADSQYDVYTISLPNTMFAGLADGSAMATLSLQGPGLVVPLFPLPGPNPPVETPTSNGANLIFSTLTITTRDSNNQVPEPSTLALSMLGLAAIGWKRRSRKS